MTRIMRRFLLAVPLFIATGVAAGHVDAQTSEARWFRGNTHAHTWNSDGDSPADVVVRWYRERGYQFVVITDHEYVTDVASLNGVYGSTHRFLILPGQEISQRVADPEHPDGRRQAHVNAIGITRTIMPMGEGGLASGVTIADTYERNLDAIREGGGVGQINHPNFRWSVPIEEMMSLPDSTLFELWNGHPLVYNDGGVDADGNAMPSTEDLWDEILTRGKLLFGVADDDSHSFRPTDADRFDLARPGRGWVQVRADTLTAEAILDGLRRGDFYSSTGVTLAAYEADQTGITVEVAPQSDRRYRIDFIGSGGRVLETVHGLSASYRVDGSEGYVRVRVTDSSGSRAWMQPIMLPSDHPPGGM